MTRGNKTLNSDCRFLSAADFPRFTGRFSKHFPIISSRSGFPKLSRGRATVSQIAVMKNYRRNGAASMILREMKARLEQNLRASNVDEEITSGVEFLGKRGFVETLVQLEMIKAL